MLTTGLHAAKFWEAQTVKKLKENGFFIVARNKKIFGIEIDIIARKQYQGETHYYFIECKYRRKESAFPVLSEKQKDRYRKAAALWQAEVGHFLNIHLSLALATLESNSILFLPDYF